MKQDFNKEKKNVLATFCLYIKYGGYMIQIHFSYKKNVVVVSTPTIIVLEIFNHTAHVNVYTYIYIDLMHCIHMKCY